MADVELLAKTPAAPALLFCLPPLHHSDQDLCVGKAFSARQLLKNLEFTLLAFMISTARSSSHLRFYRLSQRWDWKWRIGCITTNRVFAVYIQASLFHLLSTFIFASFTHLSLIIILTIVNCRAGLAPHLVNFFNCFSFHSFRPGFCLGDFLLPLGFFLW